MWRPALLGPLAPGFKAVTKAGTIRNLIRASPARFVFFRSQSHRFKPAVSMRPTSHLVRTSPRLY